MPNIKKITSDWSATGLVVYALLRRESDLYLLNDADGAFALNPDDPHLSLSEDAIIKGRYEVSESRTVWNNGLYTVTIYKQTGGSPVPVSDTVIGTGQMYIVSDTEIVLDASVSSTVGGLTAQQVRDALKLAPTVGDPAEGSIDKLIDDIPNIIIPPTETSIFSNTIYQDVRLVICRGDSPTLTFDLEDNYTGWIPWFGLKKNVDDLDYVISPIQQSWTSITLGQGTVTLLSTQTNLVGDYHGEVEVRSGESRLTVVRFTLLFEQDVIV